MASIQEGDILRLVVSLVFPDSVIMQNVFHLVITAINGTGDDDEIGVDLRQYTEALYDEIAGNISQDIDTDEIKVYVYDPGDEDFDEVVTKNWTLTPTGGTDFLPHGVAGLVLLRTLDPDVNGKKYFGGLSEDSQTAGEWGSGALANLASAAVETVSIYTDATSGNVYAPGVWSPTRVNFFAYSGTVVANTAPAYQRRRKPGVGI